MAIALYQIMMSLRESHFLEIEVRLLVLFMKKRNQREFTEDGGILVGILCYGRRNRFDVLVLVNISPCFIFSRQEMFNYQNAG